jgi:periplasmic protein TonB
MNNNQPMIYRILIPAIFLLFGKQLTAQDKKEGYFLLFDKDMKQVTLVKEASYFLNVRQLNDTAWRYDYYGAAGPRIRTETYKDEEGTIPNGRFAWYNAMGYIDSTGAAQNGKRHGGWHYYKPFSFEIEINKQYDHGLLVKEIDYRVKSNDAPTKSNDDYKEPKFKGSFKEFLEENLQFPERAQNMNLGSIVTVMFKLDEKAVVVDPLVLRSIEYSLDHEAERVLIKSSGNWKPGYKNGQPVSTWHQQSISFVLQ